MISPFLTRPIPENLRPAAKDLQRTRLYKMEREFVGVSINHQVSRRRLQELADHACRYYMIQPIKVVVFNDPKKRIFGESVYYYYDDHETSKKFGYAIRLNKGFHGANVCGLLHELAHYIVDGTYADHEEHGKKFVGVYMHLLAKYRIFPSDCFRLLAKRYRIKIAGKFEPSAIRG